VKALITGALGQVGRALLSAKPAHVEVRAYTREELDISDEAEVRRTVAEFAPSILINAAAYTAVDKAESEPALALAVNFVGPRYLAEAVRDIAGARMIQISTDYVFDAAGGTASRPADPTNPQSVYGQSKLAGEKVVQKLLGDRAVVLRTAWIYAPEGKNFLLTMLRLMKERGSVRVVADQWGSPTTAASVARAIWRIVDRPDVHGVLHWTDAGTASWYDFARAIAEEAAEVGMLPQAVDVTPIQTSEYPTAARRPLNSVLDLNESAQRLDLQPTPWRDNLRSTLRGMAIH
jgi:dTDP-4-dehydrorhamnose reductase